MDRRVRKTREALYSAFVALVAERGYDSLSVSDIIDAADVGRTTFYAHFRAKEDLLAFGFARLREQLDSVPRTGAEPRQAFLVALLSHVKSHAGLFAALVGGGAGGLAERHFRSIVEDLIADDIGPGDQHGIMVAMLSGALLAAIRRWLDTGTRGSGIEIIAAFELLLAAARQPQAR